MCGITGRINFDKDQKISEFELKEMTDSLVNRGPDDEGYYIYKNVGLGFRRLSIIDLSSGHQPLSNEDGSIWIVFNGEIYNYRELQDNLKKQGHVFSTQSDTETIIHLYEQYGTQCLQFLRGMFAFSIWDNNKKQLFCARDRFGIKPFYYYTDDEKFVFGSEIKAIVQSDGVDTSISNDALDSYFAFGYITNDLSIYKSIRKLQPSHYLLLSLNRVSLVIKKYWDIHFTPDSSKTENQWCQELENCLSETVKFHMISDVPLGAFLSGGIDSSSIVALMAKTADRPIKTFSIGFKEQKFNELKYAREIASRYGCEHHEQIIEAESINLLPKLVQEYDEPFADASSIPTYYVSKLARQFVKVVLSGDGGDELFAGYDTYAKLNSLHSSPFHFKNPKANRILWGTIHRCIPQRIAGKGLTYLLSQNREFAAAYLSFWTKQEREKLVLNEHSIQNAKGSESFKQQILKDQRSDEFISNLQFLDIRTFLVDDVLTKVDRSSMMNSLEVRVPLLDHKFAELTFKISAGLKLKGTSGKYIFKESMKPYLPESILNHPKQGFSIPINNWFKEDLKEYVYDTLLDRNSYSSRYLCQNFIKKTIVSQQKGMRDLSSKIWSLIFFEEWLKQNNLPKNISRVKTPV